MTTKIKNILILILTFIIGFGIGMIATFGIIFKKLEAHEVSLWL